MKKMGFMDMLSGVLVVIGGLNWGLVGLFKYNLVDKIFGVETFLSRAIYILVGLAALWMIYTMMNMSKSER